MYRQFSERLFYLQPLDKMLLRDVKPLAEDIKVIYGVLDTINPTIISGLGYVQILDEGVSLPQRTTLNFVGAGVTVTDIAGVTTATIIGAAGAPIYPANRIPFGDGATAGGVTSVNLQFQPTNHFSVNITDGATYSSQVGATASQATLVFVDTTNNRTASTNLISTKALLQWADVTNSKSSDVLLNTSGAKLSFLNTATVIETGVNITDRIATLGITNAAGNNTTIIVTDAAQTYTLNKLAGVGTRMVTADATGVLGVAAIPAGTVTNVSGTLPLASSGGATPAISITGLTTIGTANQIPATNNAGTAWEYKTLSTSGTAVANDVGVTLSTANAIIVNLPSASSTVRGVLTSTDWTTFNNKGSGTVTSIATVGLISGGTITTTGTITTSVTTNKLVGRATAGTGIMEEITLGTGLSYTGTTLNVSGFSSSTLTDTHIFVGNGSNVATDVAMSGEATIANTGAVTLSNAAVIAKVLTAYSSGAGVVSAADSILGAIQKLNGNTAALVTGVSSVNALTGAVALTGTTNRITISAANVFDISASYVGQASITTLGTISTGSIPFSLVTGTVPVAQGGTNITSYAIGDLIYASGATTLSKLADVATGNVLKAGGVGVAPAYGQVVLTTDVSGVLPIANGGTNAATAAAARTNLATRFNICYQSTTFTGTASSTFYFSTSSFAGTGTLNNVPFITIPIGCVLKEVGITCMVNGTLGSAGNVVVKLWDAINLVSLGTISTTFTMTAKHSTQTVTGLSISVSSTAETVIRIETPAFATAPTGCFFTINCLFE